MNIIKINGFHCDVPDKYVAVLKNMDNEPIEKKKISITIMTYNKEKVINRCIDSIIGFADEIIVVDVGSTDKTMEVVSNYGKKVKLYEMKWENSFSKIRNKMIGLTSNEIILQLDADEYFEENFDGFEFTYLISKIFDIIDEPISISPIIVNHNGTRQYCTGRIFSKRAYIHYSGHIHADLRTKENSQVETICIDAIINHDEYKDSIVKEKIDLIKIG